MVDRSSALQFENLPALPSQRSSGLVFEVLAALPGQFSSPLIYWDLEVRVAGLKGKQIAQGADGVATANLVTGVLSANAAGRAKMATGLFDNATVADKFAAASIPLTKLEETVLQADGGQTWLANQNAGGFKVTNLGDPTGAQDAASKAYVDSVSAGLDPKASSRLATTGTLPAYTPAGSGVGKTLTANANGALSLDGTAVVALDRVLVKNEGGGTSIHNGIYVVTQPGTGGTPFILTRAQDFDGTPTGEVSAGAFSFVTEGASLAGTGWFVSTADPITVDTTPITFSQFSGPGSLTYGSPVDVGAANSDGSGLPVARANHVHKAPRATSSNKGQFPSATSGDESPTGITLAETPALDGIPMVEVNGALYEVGQGVKTTDCYFSADGGTTARSIAALVAGDELIWNGVIAAFDLTVLDKVSIHYHSFP